MNREILWKALESHAMAGWRSPRTLDLPSIPAASRLLWCGIGGSLLPSETLVRALGSPEAQARWTPLASPEPSDLQLRKDDQIVFASKSGKTLELWTWIAQATSKRDGLSWTNLEIWRAFRKAGIVIPFPQVDLHLKEGS